MTTFNYLLTLSLSTLLTGSKKRPLKVRNLDRATNDSPEAHSLAPQSYTNLSNVIPCDLCTVMAQANVNGSWFRVHISVPFEMAFHLSPRRTFKFFLRSDGRSTKKSKYLDNFVRFVIIYIYMFLIF